MGNPREGLHRVRDALVEHGTAMASKPDGSWRGRCPGHGGTSADSLSLRHIEPRIGDRCGRAQLRCFGGCDELRILDGLGLSLADLYDDPPPKIKAGRVVREFPYIGPAGQMLGVVRRTAEPRSFRPATPTPNGWVGLSNDDLKATPYRLLDVIAAVDKGETVYIPEGERCADTLAAQGLAATCNAGGAGKWTDQHAHWLKGAEVVICRDRDEAGERHAEKVAKTLAGIAASVRIVEPAEGKDVTEHLAAGRRIDELVLVESVPAFPDTEAGNTGTSLYVDVAAMLDGGLPDPPTPVLLKRTDGHAIFYASQVNYLFGDPESGKTLVAQAAASEALIAGRKVAFIDIDHNGPEAIVCRFLDMNVPEETLRDPDRFRYVEPEDRAHLADVVDDLKAWRPAVAVVDSVGELLPLMGLSSNSPDDFTTGHTRVLKALAMVGACVLAIDHLAKGVDSRAQGSTGTAAKRRAVGGVSIRVTVEDQFTPGQGGSAFLTINKDRHGGLRRNCPATPGREAVAGLFKIGKDANRIAWTLEKPSGEVPKADRVDPGDLAALTALDPPPRSVRDVKDRLRWRSDRAARALREWKKLPPVPCSPGTQGEQGTGEPSTEDESVPPFPAYVSGNGERSEATRETVLGGPTEPTCIACGAPIPEGADACGPCFRSGRVPA